MTRIANGASGWRIREITGEHDKVAVTLSCDAGTETVMPVAEAWAFANRLLTICRNLQDTPNPSPEALDRFFEGVDEAMAGPVRRCCRMCHAEFADGEVASDMFELGVCSDACLVAHRRRSPNVEPPGGLERAPATYKHGKRRR